MTELALERVLSLAAVRMRIVAALRWSCVAAAAALALGAALVLVARGWPECATALFGVLWAPAVLVAVAAVAGFRLTQPRPKQVALRLDRSAGLDEHLATWEEYRRARAPEDALARSFVLAQRQATLRRAEGLEPSRHVPLVLPPWSRALWLGVLTLACALLLPERRATNAAGEGLALSGPGKAGTEAGRGAGFQPLGPGELPSSFKVQIMTQTQRFEYELKAMDPRISVEEKAKILAELEAKRGALSESELNDADRVLLANLRKQVGKEAAKTQAPKGSQALAGTATDPPLDTTLQYKEPATVRIAPELLVGRARTRYPDLAGPLEKYYRAVSEAGARP